MSKKAKGRKAIERADNSKVGFEKLRKKLDELGYEAFLADTKRRVARVYALMHTINLEDVTIREIEFNLVLWRVSCLIQIGTVWEHTARFTTTLQNLYRLDNEFEQALQSNSP